MKSLTTDTDELLYWAKEKHGFRIDRLLNPVAVGLLRDENIIAAVIYSNFNGVNVDAHILSDGSKQWLDRRFLQFMFDYPFNNMLATRITGYVDADNLAARKFDERLGFEMEGLMERASGNGGDIIIYRMFREDCRFI